MQGLREEIGSLNNRIQELESQNKALTSMLVHQLRGGESSTYSDIDQIITKQLALEGSTKENSDEDNTSADVSPINLTRNSLTLKHCNSFNSEILEDNVNEDNNSPTERVISKIEKRLSADSKLIGKCSIVINICTY